MRAAQVRSDSLRRSRATARSAPKRSIAAAVAGGSCIKARVDLGMHIEYHKKIFFVHIYIHFSRDASSAVVFKRCV
jgi:hypothetical protein